MNVSPTLKEEEKHTDGDDSQENHR